MVTETMMVHGNLIQASIEEAINPSPILGKVINRGSILEQSIKFNSYCDTAINPFSILGRAINQGSIVGKAINHKFNHGARSIYWSLPNNRLELAAALRST
jgi:hypothetical protein